MLNRPGPKRISFIRIEYINPTFVCQIILEIILLLHKIFRLNDQSKF